MENNLTKIVCYTGGTCGDLIAALIDPTGVEFHNGTILHPEYRRKLKKPRTFTNDNYKDEYIKLVSKEYLSIPSHDTEYHIKRNHRIISITVDDYDIALWAANRFKNLHTDEVWGSMSYACGAKTVLDYAQILIDYGSLVRQHTKDIIKLEDIVSGNAIKTLNTIGINNCDKNFYATWLTLQKGI